MTRRVSRRRLLLSVLPAALALTACQSVPTPSGPIAQIAPPRQISLMIPVPDKQWADRLITRTRDFQTANPNIAVNVLPITGMPRGPFDIEKWVDLLQGVASSATLDVAFGWDAWAPGMIDRGILRSLDPYLLDIGRPIDRFFMSNAVQAFRRSGRVWMLPWQAQPAMLFYNRQIFDQAGLAWPNEDWTWQTVESIGSTLTSTTGNTKVWGFDIGIGPEVLIYQNGGRIVDDPVEPTMATLEDKANVEALAWIDSLVRQYRIMPSATDFRQFDGRMAGFASGQIAMRLDVMGVRAGNYVGSPKPWDFRWAVVPPPSRVRRATTANFQSWGIISTSTQVDEAWRLLQYICTRLPVEQRIDGVPAFLALQGSPELPRLLPEGSEYYLRAMADVVPVPPVPAATAIQSALGQALSRVVLGQVTPADALRDAQQSVMKAWHAPPPPPPTPAPTG